MASVAPQHYSALIREAETALADGRLDQAERALAEIVRLNPREHFAWSMLASLALQRGEADLALVHAQRAHVLDRRNAAYLNLLAVVQAEAGQLDRAEATARRALREQPSYAEAHYNLGKVLEKRGDLAAARRAYERAVALDPRYPGARGNYALLLQRLGELEQAVDVLQAAVADDPTDTHDLVLLGKALMGARGHDAAIALYAAAAQRMPESAMLRRALAHAQLAAGDWRCGWQAYLGRDALGPRVRTELPAPLPERLDGVRIMLLAEQGLGDALFFLRFAPELVRRGARLAMRAPAKLTGLLRAAGDFDEVIAESGTNADRSAGPIPAGLVLHLGDLPYLLGSDRPEPAFPLKVRVEPAAAWRDRLGKLGPGPYVGVTWRAGADFRRGPEFGRNMQALSKEIELPALGPALARAPGTLVSLQRQPGADETRALAALAGRPVHDLSEANEDLEAALALVAVLDDYVAVSNTNVHLRAGAGQTSKVLVPFPPEWRWMARGEESPWFPGNRVYRQSARRDWTQALGALAADLVEQSP
ncbi:MAG: tetratricopeptide repeat protein [Burkholderiales bacterium]|nr:tetratricopeptide repeat protein [Burkholderiales bacterium]